nr:hypothetical protein CFP56_40551 [Quercus suber]
MESKRGGKATIDLVMGLVVLDLRLMSFGFDGFGFGVGAALAPPTRIVLAAKRKPPDDVVAVTTDSNNNNSIVVYGVDSNNQNGNNSGELGGGLWKRKSRWADDEPKPLPTSLPIQLPDFMKELTDVMDYLVP